MVEEFSTTLERMEERKFDGVEGCEECAYLEDCKEFWHFCPYDGRLAVEKRYDVEILEDSEGIL